MKKVNRINQIGVVLCLLMFAAIVGAQDPEILRESRERQEKDREQNSALANALNSAPNARVLQGKLNSAKGTDDCEKALRAYVDQSDKSVVPYLKAQMTVGSNCQIEIHVALVKLGETDYFTKTIQALSSSEVLNRIVAVEILAKIGSKEAY